MMLRRILVLTSILTCSGKKLEQRIVGGNPADINKFPHSVYLIINSGGKLWGCGASILTNMILLSAAHCLDHDGMYKIDTIYGSTNINQPNFIGHIKRYIMHPHYEPYTHICDISILLLNDAITLGTTAKRVILRPSFPDRIVAAVAGWGAMSDKGERSYSLKQVVQFVQPSVTCGGRLLLRPGMMCATSGSSDDYPARGDSGSALMWKDHQQIGIGSLKKRGDHVNQTVYTNISYFYSWIVHSCPYLLCPNLIKTLTYDKP